MFPAPRVTVVAVLALGAILPPARAQSAAAPLDKLVVVAPGLADSPVAVTRVTLETLPAGQTPLAALAEQTANFYVADSGARSFGDIFSLRGLTNTPFFGDPSVSVYLDDVPLGGGFTFPSSLAGFATGELRRGPGQNTLFGRAGPAGVLRLATPPPAASAGGELRAGYGNFNTLDVSALATSAANANADLLVAAAHDSRDGYITNTTLGSRVDDKDSQSGLARLRWRPAAGTELTLLVTGQRARDGAQPLVPLGGPLFSVARSAEGQTDVDALNAGLTAVFDTAAGRLSATTAHTYWNLGPYQNVQELFPGFELANDLSLRQRVWSEEIRLASDARAAIPWSAGVFLADGRTAGTVTRSAFGFPIEASSSRTKMRSLAAFAEATFKIGDALTLTPGLRVESSRKDFARTETVPAPGTINQRESSGAFLPKLAASYTLSPQTTLFASAGTGYKPGGFSSFTGNPAFTAFRPERTTAFEAGLTREGANRAYTATLRAFWYEIRGYQIERTFTGGDYFVLNAPRARSRGAELELEWRPAAGLTIGTTVGLTDVVLTRFTDPFGPAVMDGNRAPFVPDYDASLSVEYRDPSGWFAGVQASATGRVFYDEAETAATAQDAHGLLGARLGWENARWRVSVHGENLTTEAYYSSITAGIGHGTPGAPRTYGLDVTVKF